MDRLSKNLSLESIQEYELDIVHCKKLLEKIDKKLIGEDMPDEKRKILEEFRELVEIERKSCLRNIERLLQK